MDKKQLSERDICTKFITPALKDAGWNIRTQILEEVSFTNGKILVKGKFTQRCKRQRADYILFYKPNIPIAVIEAKDNSHSIGQGMQQAMEYAQILKVPFAYSSNGDGFLEHDFTGSGGKIEVAFPLSEFPSPENLWERYLRFKNINEEQANVIKQDYFFDISGKTPRYYQQAAINSVIEAIANGQNRILLVMATGTGKTYTAFQIIWRLWKAGIKKRILFLADRNILVDQTMTNDFKHFGDKMTKITQRKVDKSFEVYLSLYQAVTGIEEYKKIYKKFSRSFFDLIIIDECHRGSAAEDSEWREILQYFTAATQIGMTATPKETKYVSNIHYFGKPLYTYSLKQGIEDGFLAPYKVIRVHINRDIDGWRPKKGECDKFGYKIDDRLFTMKDFDRNLVIDERTQLVARRISEYLKKTNRMDKTIVFCEDIDHAERMRHALANENVDMVLQNPKYIVRITGDDEIGKKELDNFIDPEEPYPVIATTSKLMSTGVDSQTCKLIVLDKTINSMTEFKQIIGRGTRVREDFNKMFFTIIDFRNATRLFYDPNFDGEPVQVYEPKPGQSIVPPEDLIETEEKEITEEPVEIEVEPREELPIIADRDEIPRPKKYYVNGVYVQIVAEQVKYYDSEKGLVTVSLRDFTKQNILKSFVSIDAFLNRWNDAERKEVIIEELLEQGVFLEELQQKVDMELDPFDLICHIAFGRQPLTRQERANQVRKRNIFAKYGAVAQKVIDAILDKYADQGIYAIEDAIDRKKMVDFLKVSPFSDIGSPVEIINDFGDKKKYIKAVKELTQQLYKAA